MASERGWYLIAVGVLVLGLSNSLANSHPDWLQNLTDRPAATAERVSGQAERYLAMAELMFGRGEAGFGRTERARLGAMQANLARHQAEMTRMEAENLRVVALPQVRQIRVVCPRPRVVVQVPQP